MWLKRMSKISKFFIKENLQLYKKNHELEKKIEKVEEKHLISCKESQDKILEAFNMMKKRNDDLLKEATGRTGDKVLTSLKKMKTANEDFYQLLKTEGVIPS